MRNAILSKIATFRTQRKFSQEYMAAQLKITQSYYNKLEKGKIDLTLARILEIAKVLDISVTDLFQNERDASVH